MSGSWPVGGDLDRREFLRAGALALAALGAAGAGLPPGARAAFPAAAGPRLLAPRRRATYEALLMALRDAPDGRFRHRGAATGARAFADWYAGQDAAMRGHADTVLDGLAELFSGGPGARRYGALRDRPGGASPADAEARRRATIVAALGLAARTSEPDPADGDHVDRAPTAALLA